MWESVPQIVVVVIFTIASVGPHFGTGTSSMWMSLTSLNTAARIVSGMDPPLSLVGIGHPRSSGASGGPATGIAEARGGPPRGAGGGIPAAVRIAPRPPNRRGVRSDSPDRVRNRAPRVSSTVCSGRPQAPGGIVQTRDAARTVADDGPRAADINLLRRADAAGQRLFRQLVVSRIAWATVSETSRLI